MLESARSDHARALSGIAQLQTQMTFRFSVLSKLLDRQMAEIAARFDLSLIAYRALVTIDAFETATAADLVRYTGYDKAALSRVLSDLQADGLVASEDDPGHGRRKILRVTDAGQARIAAAQPDVEARRDGLSACLTEDEERLFQSAIEKLASHVAAELADTTKDAA